MKSNRFWFILLGGAVLISVITIFVIGQGPGSYASIYHDGVLTDTVNMTAVTDPFTITIDSSGSKNVIEVEFGRIRMLSADCPDGSCIRLGWSSGGAFPIVCLPNRVVVTFTGSDSRSGVDAVVG